MAMAASVPTASSTSHLIHRLLLRPPPPSFFFFSSYSSSSSSSSLFKPLCSIVSTCRLRNSPQTTPISYTSLFASSSPLLRNSFSRTLSSVNYSTSSQQQQDEEEEEEEDDDDDVDFRKIGELIEELEEDEEEEVSFKNGELGESVKKVSVDPAAMLRSRREKGMQQISMTVKEKKQLASYAQSLGKKLKSQLVGKGGITANVATSFIETLEANELIKIKVHRNCPGELDDVVKQLEELTGSVVVNRIGRTVIIYRPSLTKLKEEEKKRQARRMYVRKESSPRPRPTFVKGGQESRTSSGYGRRERHRFVSSKR